MNSSNKRYPKAPTQPPLYSAIYREQKLTAPNLYAYFGEKYTRREFQHMQFDSRSIFTVQNMQ